jgi:oligoribonuclease NrnB/cAMP/cGMP phosphodiesterase (DHH superfamily)
MWTPDVCFHHFPCADGFAAAWIARRKWPDLLVKGTNYGRPLPDVDISGKNLLIADFSYKHDVLLNLATKARSIVILDHHKTAQADLVAFKAEIGGSAKFAAAQVDAMLGDLAGRSCPAIVAHFNMQRSGAALVWEFCFPDEPLPLLVELVEDRDLWLLRLPQTRAFSLYLRSFPFDFSQWDSIADRLARNSDSVFGEATAIERFYDQKVAELVPGAVLKTIGRWKNVPVAHAPAVFASDLADKLLKAHPDAPFAAVVVEAYGNRTYELRSDDSRQDVSEVARTFGGGGHRNAAAFRVPAG